MEGHEWCLVSVSGVKDCMRKVCSFPTRRATFEPRISRRTRPRSSATPRTDGAAVLQFPSAVRVPRQVVTRGVGPKAGKDVSYQHPFAGSILVVETKSSLNVESLPLFKSIVVHRGICITVKWCKPVYIIILDHLFHGLQSTLCPLDGWLPRSSHQKFHRRVSYTITRIKFFPNRGMYSLTFDTQTVLNCAV